MSKINWFRAGVAVSAILAASAPLAPAYAQAAATGSDAASDEAADQPTVAAGDAIVVTGSRIRRDPLDQDAPIVVLDRTAIENTGLSSIADVLQRLPSSGGGLNSKFNNSGNFGNPPDGGGVGAGAAEIDLRYLSSRRTLVLVDGLRFVNGASASGIPAATDLNAMPIEMIDHIEVLQDGASPIYGSDAIAGVVNIITRERQEGFRASFQYGQYLKYNDGRTIDANLSWGGGTETTRVVIGASYVDQRSVSSGDRSISLFPEPGGTSCLDGGCSSGTPLGRFLVLDQNLTLRAPVIGRNPVYNPLNPTDPASDFKEFTTADRFNFAPYNFVQSPSQRFGVFGSFLQDIGSSTHFRTKVIYTHRESANQAAPLPLFVGPDAGNGNLLDRISIDATNPFNPFGVTLSAGGAGNPAANYNFIGRRFVENGARRYYQDVDTIYATASLDGSFALGGRTFYWDVNGVYGHNDAHQTFLGNVNAQKLAQALGPVALCTGACVPFNIFGGVGSITPEMIDYVTFTERAKSDQDLRDVSANLTGSLFDLPGGPLGIAVGYEHRDQRGSFDPDPIVTAGFGSDIPAQPSSGRFNVDEIYGELRAPLLADQPFFRQLDASFAARLSNYSTFGSETTLKAGLNWKPVEDLLLRGSWGQGFRAPGIGELFGTPSRFDQELVDPCSAVGGAIPAGVRANCIIQGVPADGSYVQANPQLSVITGGNPNLQPEKSKSWIFGAVYSPSWVRGSGFASRLDLEANYYDINVDGAIQPIGADVLLGRCTDTNDAFSCASVSRTASGAISQIRGLLQNIGSIKTRGIDLIANYRTPQSSAGSFGLYWSSNFLLEFSEEVPATVGFTKIERKGTERGSPDQAYPKFKSTGTFDWTKDAFMLSVTGRYISAVTESQNGNRMGSRFYTDFRLGLSPGFLQERFTLSLGVNNLFDKDPPGCSSCGLNNFDPTTYDVPGRYGYVELKAKF
ncbi:TonB-dependent receptor [Sphingorhabdus soli]|uniref:TonB-dependent receptor n=1 Tax=Flavisphingopyxis soli TaxID=2601267 RepID=A0A5C6U7X6_9SPHN|nr:TonB-dependent receptor [Sphingorhabdus soli]TXC69002.1 TonB-dependent receptor [Sphingorhabdus soli]